jgi:hypothetical protein
MKSILCALMLASLSSVSASVIFIAEAPGVQSTTVANTTTVDFNSLPVGPLGTFVSAIGTYTSDATTGAGITGPTIFGGANQTNYIGVGTESNTLSYSLQFKTPQTFFGFLWLAMDIANEVQFFKGTTLVGTVTAANVINADITSLFYFGNPTTGSDPNEPFAYVDFYSDDPSTNFDSVTFSNVTATTGFESDNHSILTPAPEPSTIGMILPVAGAIAFAIRRRHRRA